MFQGTAKESNQIFMGSLQVLQIEEIREARIRKYSCSYSLDSCSDDGPSAQHLIEVEHLLLLGRGVVLHRSGCIDTIVGVVGAGCHVYGVVKNELAEIVSCETK